MAERPRTTISLELASASVEFPHPIKADRSGGQDPPAEGRWEAAFRLVHPDQLVLSDRADTRDMRIYLRLVTSLDAADISPPAIEERVGYLRYLGHADPPLADGVLLLEPAAFHAAIESIRFGRGTVRVLLSLTNVGASLSLTQTHWDVKDDSRPVIVGARLKIHFGEPGVHHQFKEEL